MNKTIFTLDNLPFLFLFTLNCDDVSSLAQFFTTLLNLISERTAQNKKRFSQTFKNFRFYARLVYVRFSL